MGCNCGHNRDVTKLTSKMVLVEYTTPKGRDLAQGPVSKKNYGYRTRGEKFQVYEADALTRPDLYRMVVEEKPDPRPEPKKPQPLPPSPVPITAEEAEFLVADDMLDMPLSSIEYKPRRIGPLTLQKLANCGYQTVRDVLKTNEEKILELDIGPAATKELFRAVHALVKVRRVML